MLSTWANPPARKGYSVRRAWHACCVLFAAPVTAEASKPKPRVQQKHVTAATHCLHTGVHQTGAPCTALSMRGPSTGHPCLPLARHRGLAERGASPQQHREQYSKWQGLEAGQTLGTLSQAQPAYPSTHRGCMCVDTTKQQQVNPPTPPTTQRQHHNACVIKASITCSSRKPIWGPPGLPDWKCWLLHPKGCWRLPVRGRSRQHAPQPAES